MSEKYKIHEDGLYFVSFSVVGWIDVFTRRDYQEILICSIEFCQKHKGLKIYCYCIMPNHIHFISISENDSLTNILRGVLKIKILIISGLKQENEKLNCVHL